MLFKKASHKKKAEHIVKNMINSSMEKHAGQYTVIFMPVKKMIPGEASLVDPDVLPADHTGNICLQEDNYIDQDQNSGGRVQITMDIAVIIFGDVFCHIIVCIWFHIIVSFLFFSIVVIKNRKVKWIDIFLKCV